MALYESSQPCCSGNDCSDSICCSEEGEVSNAKSTDENACCTDVVKYFHQQSTTTIKENFNLKSFQVWISILITQVPVSVRDNLAVIFEQDSITPARAGRSIITSVSSLLI